MVIEDEQSLKGICTLVSNRPLYWLVLAELNVKLTLKKILWKKGTKAATGTIPFQKVHISTYWDDTPVTAFAPFFLSIEEKDKHILDKSSLNIIKVHIWILSGILLQIKKKMHELNK